MAHPIKREALDFSAHAGSALLALTIASALGTDWTPAGAVGIAWGFGFVREFTEWQDGGKHPFTRWGLLDQAGWAAGGLIFTFVAHLWRF